MGIRQLVNHHPHLHLLNNLPQPNDNRAIKLLENLQQQVNDLTNTVRTINPQSSPTVRVDRTAIGTTFHASPPQASTPPQSSDARWS